MNIRSLEIPAAVLGGVLITLFLAAHVEPGLAAERGVPQPPAEESLSEPVPIDPDTDNAQFLDHMSGGLIISLELVRTEARLLNARVALVPSGEIRESTEGCFRVIGFQAGEPVATQWVPDPRFRHVEGGGVEEREVRTASFALPLATRIDMLTVQVEPDVPVTEMDVGPVFAEYCDANPDDLLCK